MNKTHLEMCSSAEWAETVERHVIPWVLDGVELGDDVLEVGPGPGLTTDVLRTKTQHLTAVEIHDDLAAALAERMAGSNVDVIHGDATQLPFEDDRFTGAVCLTMLHHVPTDALQDKLLAEVCRVLRPGGVFAGEDGIASDELRELHVDDTYVPIDPSTFSTRLTAAGFTDIHIDVNQYALRFRASKPRVSGGRP